MTQKVAAKKQAAIEELRKLIGIGTAADPALRSSWEVMHAGYPDASIGRFLKARDYDASKAHHMLTECLKWRIKNEVDTILSRPLEGDRFEKIRATQLYGMSGFDHQGRPVLVVRVGLSSMDPEVKIEEYMHSHIQHNEYRDTVLLPMASKRAGTPVTSCVKIMDMTGLRLSSLSRMKAHTAVASIDDLNYPEKAEVYYIVNSPSVFSMCWKTVKPLLQDRTRKKMQVLSGSGKTDLLKVMDESVLPHFVRLAPVSGLGSVKDLAELDATTARLGNGGVDCCSSTHPFHVEMQAFIEEQWRQRRKGMLTRDMSRPRGMNLEAPLDEDEEDGEELEVVHVLEEALKEASLITGTNGASGAVHLAGAHLASSSKGARLPPRS